MSDYSSMNWLCFCPITVLWIVQLDQCLVRIRFWCMFAYCAAQRKKYVSLPRSCVGPLSGSTQFYWSVYYSRVHPWGSLSGFRHKRGKIRFRSGFRKHFLCYCEFLVSGPQLVFFVRDTWMVYSLGVGAVYAHSLWIDHVFVRLMSC